MDMKKVFRVKASFDYLVECCDDASTGFELDYWKQQRHHEAENMVLTSPLLNLHGRQERPVKYQVTIYKGEL
jgi:hypothetical protein